MASVGRTTAKKKKAPAKARRGQRQVTRGKKRGARPVNPPVKAAPVRSVAIEPLDPWLICGPDTSVEELWRVKEQVGRETAFHLVFFDKYGWYCEHGRECKAVADVRCLITTLGAKWAVNATRIAKKTE